MSEAPKILYVCASCWHGASEACGRHDPDELRQGPTGWTCDLCYDEERADISPEWHDLPKVETPTAAAVRAERERCARVVKNARFSGYTDLRSITAAIEGGDDAT